jgi:hypothetical protein
LPDFQTPVLARFPGHFCFESRANTGVFEFRKLRDAYRRTKKGRRWRPFFEAANR